MATLVESRKPASKAEAYLERKFAEVCSRIRWLDLGAQLLAGGLLVAAYALVVCVCDWGVGSSSGFAIQAARWSGFAVFVCLFAFLCVQIVRFGRQRVNPYFVAHQLEATLPDAKNSLVNWLDLHDEELPTAFQKPLSARAAETLQQCDTERMMPRRANYILLGLLAALVVGIAALLDVLGPAAFGASMLRAFL